MKYMNFFKKTAAALVIAAVALTGCDKDDDPDPIKVSGVSLDKSELNLTVGGTATLTATVAPDDAANKEVTWSINPLDIAIIGDNGEVIAMKPGTATITVTTDEGGKTATCTVIVTETSVKPVDPVGVNGVTLNKTALTLVEGSSETLTATVAPADATIKAITWKSDNADVATVDVWNGKITAVAAGTATITATTVEGDKTATCVVTVTAGIQVPMTLTTAIEGNVKITLGGTGTAIINWGDGSDPETFVLSKSSTVYPHTFSGATSRIITISGQNITTLNCSVLQLTALDITKNTVLTVLHCIDNQLTTLDVTKNTALRELWCVGNQLTTLDVSQNTALKNLGCNNNQLTNLDITNNTALTVLYCNDNQLTSLDLTKNTALTNLYCTRNQLTALDMTKNTVLYDLVCDQNQLMSLDVTKNTALKRLVCYNNELTNLDVKNNTALTELRCTNNELTSLDVKNNTALTELECGYNELTNLNVSKNTALTLLECRRNQFTAEGLNALFGTLNNIAGSKKIYIAYNSGTATCDRTIATAKGWTVVMN